MDCLCCKNTAWPTAHLSNPFHLGLLRSIFSVTICLFQLYIYTGLPQTGKTNYLQVCFLMSSKTFCQCILPLTVILWSLVTSISIRRTPPTAKSNDSRLCCKIHDLIQIVDVPMLRGGHILKWFALVVVVRSNVSCLSISFDSVQMGGLIFDCQ